MDTYQSPIALLQEPEVAPSAKAAGETSKHSEARLNRLCSDRLLAGLREATHNDKQEAAVYPSTASPAPVEEACAPLQASNQQAAPRLLRLSSDVLLDEAGCSSACDAEVLASPAPTAASLVVDTCHVAAGERPALAAEAEPAPAPSTPTQQARRRAQKQQQKQKQQQCKVQQHSTRQPLSQQRQQPSACAAQRCKGASSALEDFRSCQMPSAVSLLFLLACYPAPDSIDSQAAQAEQEQQLRDWMAAQKASSQQIIHAAAHRSCNLRAAGPRQALKHQAAPASFHCRRQ